jgi:hypothetical protein
MAEQQGYSLQWHSGQEVTGGKGMSEAVRMRPVGEGFSRARARLCQLEQFVKASAPVCCRGIQTAVSGSEEILFALSRQRAER